MKIETYIVIGLLTLLLAACASQAFSYTVSKTNNREDAIVVDGKTVHVYHNFQKPTPCDTVIYEVLKEGNVIDVKAKPGAPFDGMCIQMIATETVDISMTLPRGKYTVTFHNYWGAAEGTESLQIE